MDGVPVWKSTSELGYAWAFVNHHAIEPTRSRRQRRVDRLKTARHRADAATETTSRRWRGRPKFDFHTAACLTLPNVPSPSVRPISYLPTCFLAAIVQRATAAETDALAGGSSGCGRREQLGVCPRVQRVMTRRRQLPSDASASAWRHSAFFAGALLSRVGLAA